MRRSDHLSAKHDEHPDLPPAGGWHSVSAVGEILLHENAVLAGSHVLKQQNKPGGVACVGCAWTKPAKPHAMEFCDSGAKATAWEVTGKRVTAGFLAEHPLRELEAMDDHHLEALGRLTEPLRWEADSDRYVAVAWDEAFAEIGRELRAIDPQAAVFYASGRASLETSYMFQLLARMYGSNNMPACTNMCHESTSVGLQQSIGVPVGTVVLEDFDHADCLLFFGENVGTNAPRMLHTLEAARKRDVPIITFNPLRERGLVSFANPQSPTEMLTPKKTIISTQYHQVRAGGDTAVIMGMCKALLAADDAAIAAGTPRVLDAEFIAEHTKGFDDFASAVRNCSWQEIEKESGLTQTDIEQAARVYARAQATIGIYGMGLTQHRTGVRNVRMLCNLMLLRGNIGRPGAGLCPVRGHSNVQGQRTVGITEKPELAPLDKLAELYAFEPPRHKGRNTVQTCAGIMSGEVRAFFGLGGNFLRVTPDTAHLEPAWRKLRLTVQIATKLNRSHVVHGQVAYLLPCLGRLEMDRQTTGEQAVTIEDATGCIHGSKGVAQPASDQLKSEPAILAGIAKHLLEPNPRVAWDNWVGDYSLVRDAIARTFPQIFHDYNQRMWTPGGFHRPLAARSRVWETPNGKANFVVPASLDENPDMPVQGSDVLRLITLRSDDQFTSSVYSYDDTYRGIKGSREVLLMNRHDMQRLRIGEADALLVSTAASDGHERRITLRATAYDIPVGCAAGYYPECNPLIPLWHHAEESMVPAAKFIPVRVAKVV
jgi:molybdopterin-dependent oxidoreductase alpha subunit